MARRPFLVGLFVAAAIAMVLKGTSDFYMAPQERFDAVRRPPLLEFDASVARPIVWEATFHPPEGILLVPRRVEVLYLLLCDRCNGIALDATVRQVTEAEVDGGVAAVTIVATTQASHDVASKAMKLFASTWVREGSITVSPLLFGDGRSDDALTFASGLDYVEQRYNVTGRVVMMKCCDSRGPRHTLLASGGADVVGDYLRAVDLRNKSRAVVALSSLAPVMPPHRVRKAVSRPIAFALVASGATDMTCVVDTLLSLVIHEPEVPVKVFFQKRVERHGKRVTVVEPFSAFLEMCKRFVPAHFLVHVELFGAFNIAELAVLTNANALIDATAQRSIGSWLLGNDKTLSTVIVLTDDAVVLRSGLSALPVTRGVVLLEDVAREHRGAFMRVPSAMLDDQDALRRYLREHEVTALILTGVAGSHPMLPSRQAPRFRRLAKVAHRMLAPRAKEKYWCNPLTLEGCAPYAEKDWTTTCTRRRDAYPLRLKPWTPREPRDAKHRPHFRVMISMLSSSHAPYIVMDNLHAWMHYCRACGFVLDSVGGMANEMWELLHEAKLLDRVLLNGEQWLEIPFTGQVGQRHLRNARSVQRAGWTFERIFFTALNELPFRGGFDEYVLRHDGYDPQSLQSAAAEAMWSHRAFEDPGALGVSSRAVSASFAMLQVPSPIVISGRDGMPYNQYHLWCLDPVSNGTWGRGLPVGTSTQAFEGLWITWGDVQRYVETIDLDVAWSYDSANEHYFLLGVLLEHKLRGETNNETFGGNTNLYNVYGGAMNADQLKRYLSTAPPYKYSVKRVSRSRYYGGAREYLRRVRLGAAADAVNVTTPGGPLFRRWLQSEGAFDNPTHQLISIAPKPGRRSGSAPTVAPPPSSPQRV